MKGAIKLPMSSVMKSVAIDVRVTGIKTARFRLWLGGKIIVLGAAIIGCSVDIRP